MIEKQSQFKIFVLSSGGIFQKKKKKKRSTQSYQYILHNGVHQNIHVMLSSANISKKQNKKRTTVIWKVRSLNSSCFVFSGGIFYIKKNGAHKHCSLCSDKFASKYSRHVVLCKYSNSIQIKSPKCVRIISDALILIWNPDVNIQYRFKN